MVEAQLQTSVVPIWPIPLAQVIALQLSLEKFLVNVTE